MAAKDIPLEPQSTEGARDKLIIALYRRFRVIMILVQENHQNLNIATVLSLRATYAANVTVARDIRALTDKALTFTDYSHRKQFSGLDNKHSVLTVQRAG